MHVAFSFLHVGMYIHNHAHVHHVGCRFECSTDLSAEILRLLTDTVHEFLCDGALMLAKVLRRKIVEKVETRRLLAEDMTHHQTLWEAHQMSTK